MCYSVKDSPGIKISSPEPFDLIKEEIDIELGYDNFCVLLFHYDSLEFLFLKGADVNAESNSGGTPLDVANTWGHRPAADLLRKHGGKTFKELKAEGK